MYVYKYVYIGGLMEYISKKVQHMDSLSLFTFVQWPYTTHTHTLSFIDLISSPGSSTTHRTPQEEKDVSKISTKYYHLLCVCVGRGVRVGGHRNSVSCCS